MPLRSCHTLVDDVADVIHHIGVIASTTIHRVGAAPPDQRVVAAQALDVRRKYQ